MGTELEAVELAASQLGVSEARDGGTPYHDWYGAPHSWAWCCIFVSWSLANTGTPVGPQARGSAWVSGLIDWLAAPATPGRVVPISEALPGDVIPMEWGTTPGGYDHVGLLESRAGDTFTLIEGNTSNRVMRHRRSIGQIGSRVVGRPAYTAGPPPPQEDDDVLAKDLMVRDTRPGRQGATYLTTVYVNTGARPAGVGELVGSHAAVLLPDADTVNRLQRSGVEMIDVHAADPFLLGTIGVLECARDHQL